MSFLLAVLAWWLLAATVMNGVGRWSRESSASGVAHVAVPVTDLDEQR